MAAQTLQLFECLLIRLAREFGIAAGFLRLAQHEISLIGGGRIHVRQAGKRGAAITAGLFRVRTPQFHGRQQQFAQRRF